jgi:hypothetical protein
MYALALMERITDLEITTRPFEAPRPVVGARISPPVQQSGKPAATYVQVINGFAITFASEL